MGDVLNRMTPDATALLVIDMQGRLLPAIHEATMKALRAVYERRIRPLVHDR